LLHARVLSRSAALAVSLVATSHLITIVSNSTGRAHHGARLVCVVAYGAWLALGAISVSLFVAVIAHGAPLAVAKLRTRHVAEPALRATVASTLLGERKCSGWTIIEVVWTALLSPCAEFSWLTVVAVVFSSDARKSERSDDEINKNKEKAKGKRNQRFFWCQLRTKHRTGDSHILCYQQRCKPEQIIIYLKYVPSWFTRLAVVKHNLTFHSTVRTSNTKQAGDFTMLTSHRLILAFGAC
jgi:hypothetical protein